MMKLITFLEIHRMFGVQRVFLYTVLGRSKVLFTRVFWMTPVEYEPLFRLLDSIKTESTVAVLLRRYVDSGLLVITPFQWSRIEGKIYYFGQKLVLNDCLYRLLLTYF